MQEVIELEDAYQTSTDGLYQATNPIHRNHEFGSKFDEYPYSCTSTSPTEQGNKEWNARFVLKNQ